MAEFVVKIADERGHTHQQVEQGYSVAEVRDRFASQGYLVYWVKPQGLLSSGFSMGRQAQAEAEFVSGFQPAILDSDQGRAADFEFARSADQAAEGCQSAADFGERARAGKGRRVALRCLCRAAMVPKIYTTTLMAGEKSGNIDEVLTRYINFQRLAMTFRKKLFVSLIYPTLLVTVVTIMVMFLFTYVVPKFAELFNSLDAKLPAITLFMLAVGVNAQKYFPFIDRRWCWLALCSGSGERRTEAPIRLTA